jgi:hypothetical protein
VIAILFILLSPFAFVTIGMLVLDYGVEWYVHMRQTWVLGKMLEERRRQREADSRRYDAGGLR